MTTLDQLQPGDEATVLDLQGEPETCERLMEMGLVPSTPLRVLKFAPLGDPMEIVMRGYHLTLRKHEAAGVQVEVLSA
jgi:Fe2+ transport system protein FeoA